LIFGAKLEGAQIKDLIYHHKETLGLDIGTSSVKFAQLKQSGKLTKLVGYGKLSIPENIIIEGVIAEPEKLAEILAKNFTEPPWGKITAKRVIASLPESRLFSRVLELPIANPKDIEEAINYEVEQSIPIPASDLYIDWQVIEEKKEKSVIFLSAAPRAIVNSYVQLFEMLKVEPIAFEISMAAIARSMVSNKVAIEPVIILDFGGDTTNLAVFDSNLRVTESHPVGGDTIKQRLIKETEVDEKEASKVIHEGLLGQSKGADIIKEETEKIVDEIKKMIDYYSDNNGGKQISKVLLCGGLGFLPGLPEFIKSKINIDSKIGNPWVNISIYPLKPVPKEEAPGYAAAIGLCLRGFSDD
jgi:type IV pilus assembly protein PilM